MRRQIVAVGMVILLATAWGSPLKALPQQPAHTPVGTGGLAAVPDQTRFLVRLEDTLSTKKHKAGKKFKARTLDPLEARDGTMIPVNSEVRGHISRIEPAGLTGRARMWLSFDEIKTKHGKLPLVAHVASVPGEHNVRPGESKEGEIEARTSKGTQELQAAAIGAAVGAAVGATRSGKAAALGAVLGGAAGFLVASGLGQELELQKGTKLELELDRPLYLDKK